MNTFDHSFVNISLNILSEPSFDNVLFIPKKSIFFKTTGNRSIIAIHPIISKINTGKIDSLQAIQIQNNSIISITISMNNAYLSSIFNLGVRSGNLSIEDKLVFQVICFLKDKYLKDFYENYMISSITFQHKLNETIKLIELNMVNCLLNEK